jgi:hypothetical protein
MRIVPLLLVMTPLLAQAQARQAVVVELFTSEGCSSCPAADALLERIERASPVPGVEVIALEEHVDYWNALGWTDPFSSPAFTARQSGYAARFGRDSVYTPQAVVDGSAQLVGTREQQLVEQIRSAAMRPAARVVLARAGKSLRVTVSGLPTDADPASEVLLAWTEPGLSTDVPRGENRGAHLTHASVVRELQKLGTLRDGKLELEVKIMLPGTIAHAERARLVVLVQEPGTRRILGAAGMHVGAPAR